MSTLLLCDDHRVVREALASMLTTVPGLTTVHQAGSGEEVLARYPALAPDAVVLDIRMPGLDGVEVTRLLLGEHPDARVLLLSGEAREEDRVRGLRVGAVGFLPKDVDAAGLCSAVAAVLAGEDLLSRAQRRAVSTAEVVVTGPSLSPRELQVLEGMAAGRSNREIGKSLWVSEDTVKVHAKKLFVKTGVHDRAAAVAWAFRRGVLC
ncbi:MAG: two component transcriptional regulator, LuxR family [Frankiales bacterium]|nr:two component transcriptional regulator, LuxR family [Frankiales bacterium]